MGLVNPLDMPYFQVQNNYSLLYTELQEHCVEKSVLNKSYIIKMHVDM